MKNKYLKLSMFMGAILTASTVAQADFEIKNTDSENVAYTIYADDYEFDYDAGMDVVNEEGLKIVVSLETVLEANTQDPFLIFYHQNNISTPDIYFGNNGIVKIPAYCSGFQDEHPTEEGRISAVYYLKSPEETGMDISMELYAPEFSTYAKLEEKSGKSFLAAIQLTDKDKTSESTVLVPVIEGKADEDLWWYLDEADTDAEILGVLPLEPLSEEDCSVEVEQWNLRGDVISEWSTYNSGATFVYKEPIVGISAYGCEDNGDTGYTPMDNSQWDYYNISIPLSESLLSKIGTEDDKTLLEMAMNEMPKEEPKVSLYGIAVPDEVNVIPVKSVAEDSFGDILQKASAVSISLFDGTTYDSYDEYNKAMDPNVVVTEPETEAASEEVTDDITEIVTEEETEVITEEVTEEKTEVITEEETEAITEETEKEYTDNETIQKTQEMLSVLGYNPGKIDGKMGKKTIAALNEFQKAEGMEISDKITDSILEALEKAEAETELQAETEPETETVTAQKESEMVYEDYETVRDTQKMLRMKGYDPGTIDGKIGKKTIIAMHELQKAEGLEESDQITKSFLKALADAEKVESKIVYEDYETVRNTQKMLRMKGYDPGTIDGKMGKKTIIAMHEFQKAEGIEESDQITRPFLRALGLIK